MQLTLATQPLQSADELLVLERWSEARPAHLVEVAAAAEADVLDELAAQLQIRLDETQLPLWDQRKRA